MEHDRRHAAERCERMEESNARLEESKKDLERRLADGGAELAKLARRLQSAEEAARDSLAAERTSAQTRAREVEEALA